MLYVAPKKEKNPHREEWIHEILNIQSDIEHARARFNMATEEELIDQCVYELNALQSRYAYFMRLIRENEAGTAAAR